MDWNLAIQFVLTIDEFFDRQFEVDTNVKLSKQ